MIDEDVLRGLLSEAADAAPPPGAVPDDLLAGLRDGAPPVTPARWRPTSTWQLAAAAVAVLVLVAGIAAVVSGRGAGDATTAATSVADAPATTIPSDLLAEEPSIPASLGYEDAAAPAAGPVPPLPAGTGGGGGTAASGGVSGSVAPPAAAALADSALVLKTGSMTLEVSEGGYDRTVDLVTTKVAGLGGYVAESTTSRSGEHPSGFLVVRVPSEHFDPVMADLRKLGTVVAEDRKGTDVSGAHADLEARLASLRATREQLETVRTKATGVDQILMVQDRITGVQTEIEQLQGQLAGLEDQVAMASITLHLGEPGAERVTASRPDDGGLGGAWDEARERFGDGVEGLVSWSGSAAVVLLVGVVLLAVGRFAWVRLRRSFI